MKRKIIADNILDKLNNPVYGTVHQLAFPTINSLPHTWIRTPRVNLTKEPVGTLIYMYAQGLRINYLMQIQEGNQVSIWINENDGAWKFPTHLFGSSSYEHGEFVAHPGELVSHTSIFFPYFKWDIATNELLHYTDETWVQDFPHFRVSRP